MTLATSDISFLQDMIANRSGHVISNEQSYLFETRLERVAVLEGLESVEQLVRKLQCSDSVGIQDRVTEAMTINETFFFRDMRPFETLQNVVIPDLIAARKQQKRLRIWSAACSTGQEPYSIAIVIREHFPELADWDIEITASDISNSVLTKADQGQFTHFEVNRGLPARLLVKHFECRGASWVVNNDVRELVNFRRLNLTQPWPPMGTYDIVFLRNVMIYFNSQTKESIVNRMRSVIADDGVLFLGGGESLLGIDAPFLRETVDNSVFFRPERIGNTK